MLQWAWADKAPFLCCREEKAQEKSRKKAERQAAGGGYVRHSVAAADMAAYGHAGRKGDYVGCQQLALVGFWACCCRVSGVAASLNPGPDSHLLGRHLAAAADRTCVALFMSPPDVKP